MQLDYRPERGYFIVTVDRSDPGAGVLISELMQEHGLSFSLPASTPQKAVLFTKEPYAAAAFAEHATPVARERLLAITSEIDKSWATASTRRIACPADQELSPFQVAGVGYALDRHNTLIGDQPGLGKTMQAICLANEMQAERVLVVCPASIRLQWAKQIRKWTTMRWPYQVYPILHGKSGVHPTAQWLIVSYDLIRSESIGRALTRGKYDLLILDEGHFLKTIDAGRTRAVFGGGDNRKFDPIASRAERIVALTGTPLPNRPREAYTLARGLCWDAIDFMSERTFSERFNPSITRVSDSGKVYIDERTGRHSELQSRLRANFMVRRLKRVVMPQLKLPVYDIVQVEETGAVKQALAAESLLGIDPTDWEGADMDIMGEIATVRRLMGVAIAPLAAEYTSMVLDGGEEKVVVFFIHHEAGDILEQRLNKYGVVRIDGRHSAVQKESRKLSFIADPTKRVFLGQMLSVGTGTDGLQEVCSHCIAAEPDWTPGNNVQAVDRLDRGGQERTVQADFLVAPGSFAEKVLAKAIAKGHVTHKALDRRLEVA